MFSRQWVEVVDGVLLLPWTVRNISMDFLNARKNLPNFMVLYKVSVSALALRLAS